MSDIAWERVHSCISHPILSAVSFIVPFQVHCVRCSFQLLLRSLFHFKSVAFVVHFNCCFVRSSISFQLLLFISIAVAFVVPFQVRCVRCSFQLLLHSLFHFKSRCIRCSISSLLHSLFHFKSVVFAVPFHFKSPCRRHVIQILTILLRSCEESYKETYSG